MAQKALYAALLRFMISFCYRMSGPSGRKKVFRLSDVVQPLTDAEIEKLTSKAVRRILHSEKTIAQSGMAHVSDLSFSSQ